MASTSQTELTQLLTSLIKSSEELNRLPPSVKNLLSQSIDSQVESYSGQFINRVDGESNFQLNNIPRNTIGPNNPVDLISSNLNGNQLSNNLLPNVQEKTQPELSSSLVNNIFNTFKNQLPTNKAAGLNLDNIFSSLASSTTGAVGQGLSTVLSNFSKNALSGQLPLPPIVEGIDSFFSSNPSNALQQIDEQYSTTVSASALNEAKNFNIKSKDNEEKLITQTTGFIDPTATYPTKSYANQSEVNKLARGDLNGTIVQKKEKERTKGIQLPNEDSWEQPPIPFKGEYPYNKVYESESGHIIEIDDSSGGERIQIYHRTGTFIEIDANGTVVKKTKGNSYELIDKNGYISVTGDASLSVRGSIKIYVGGDADIEVEGDTNLKCFNDITMQAAGRVDISATEEINLHSANINIEADVDLSMRGDVNAFLHSTDIYTKANNNIYVETLNNHYLYSANLAYVQTLDSYHVKSGSTIYNETYGSYNIKAIGDINEDGARIYLNSGTSQSASDSLQSKYSYAANIGMIGVRRDVVYETIPDPIPPTYLDEKGYKAEDSELESESAKQASDLKTLGIAKESDLNQNAIEIDKESPASKNNQILKPSEDILIQTYLPDNYQLSKHFTLGMLSSQAAVSKYPVRAQLGLKYGEIVYNLQGIALNVLEPLLALYPNMLVTSAFRTAANSSTTSDHPRGKAVDIQFKGVAKSEYFDIAKKLATQLNYDKLLLEYKTYGTGMPWIHISFDVNSPRKLVFTYFNDKKYGDGLISIA